MSYPYFSEVHFGSEHSFSDSVVSPKVDDATSESEDDNKDGEVVDDVVVDDGQH